jgi:hypothetical protein
MPSIIKKAYAGLKQRYDKAQTEKKRYQEVDKKAKQIRDTRRYEAYEKTKMDEAATEGIAEGKARATGRRGSAPGNLRRGTMNILGELSQGSANALKSGMFDIGGKGTFSGLEDVTGMTGDSGNTLKEIEFATGVSKRQRRIDQNLKAARGGMTVNINLGRSQQAARNKEIRVQRRRQRDWQDDLEELTGF